MSERITKNEVHGLAESVREVVDVLAALHEEHALPSAELHLFISLKNALASYDARLSHE